jgi:hypothetical protein
MSGMWRTGVRGGQYRVRSTQSAPGGVGPAGPRRLDERPGGIDAAPPGPARISVGGRVESAADGAHNEGRIPGERR